MSAIIEFLKQNVGTIAVLAILATVITLIAVRIVRNKRRGVSSCGCGCSDCPYSGKCHAGAENKDQKN
jgi:hypothetical protein